MKLIISLCVVIAVVSAVEQEKYKLPPEILKNYRELAEPCAAEFNVDPINIKKLGDDRLPRDEATNNFLYCFALNTGFIYRDGHIIVDAVASVVEAHPRANEFRKAIEKCAEISMDDPVATAIEEHICYCETSPLLFDFESE